MVGLTGSIYFFGFVTYITCMALNKSAAMGQPSLFLLILSLAGLCLLWAAYRIVRKWMYPYSESQGKVPADSFGAESLIVFARRKPLKRTGVSSKTLLGLVSVPLLNTFFKPNLTSLICPYFPEPLQLSKSLMTQFSFRFLSVPAHRPP